MIDQYKKYKVDTNFGYGIWIVNARNRQEAINKTVNKLYGLSTDFNIKKTEIRGGIISCKISKRQGDYDFKNQIL